MLTSCVLDFPSAVDALPLKMSRVLSLMTEPVTDLAAAAGGREDAWSRFDETVSAGIYR
jgi:hypothetical protein